MMGNVLRIAGMSANENHLPSALSESEDDVLVVIQDYPPSQVREPLFRMGEKLKIISSEVNWWKVHSLRTGRENYIPSSHVAKVYHGWLFEGVARQNAEELLLLPVNRQGSFMVRENTNERGVYSLSVKHRNIKHYRIFRLDNSWYYISPRLTFQCLEDMVNHYSDSADGLCCALTTPCLSGKPTLEAPPSTPPVVMRRRFDWNAVDRKDLVNRGNPTSPDNVDSMVSYGVRNSLADYLSLAAMTEDPQQKNSKKKKSKSICVLPGSNFDILDYEGAF